MKPTEPNTVYGIKNYLVHGDAMNPASDDIISQVGLVRVGDPVPADWRVLTGNAIHSSVGRTVMRYEIDDLAL